MIDYHSIDISADTASKTALICYYDRDTISYPQYAQNYNPVLQEFDIFMQNAYAALQNVEITFATRLFGFNEKTKNQLLVLFGDYTINNHLKYYIKKQNAQTLADVFHNPQSQDELLNILYDYTRQRDYRRLHWILKSDIVKNEIKKYMSGC